MKCLSCNKELTGRQTKYCSTQCQKKHQQDNYILLWKQGLETGITGEYQISHRVRNYMLEKAKYKCSKCGWGECNPYTQKIPLEIHHKDGNYQHTTEDNLEVLCPNCHSLTENFRNRGKGREERQKRYMTGICPDCGKTIANTSTRCAECNQHFQKQNYLNQLPISREELKNRIRTETLTGIARDFDITANGLRRWLQAYGLPDTKTKINTYTEENWEFV